MEFYVYKPKQERSLKVVFKYKVVFKVDLPSSNVDNRKEIESQRYIVIDVWSIQKQGIKTLPMLYVELKEQ